MCDMLSAGVAGMDSQTALAVQSLLESQTVAEQPAQVEDEDVFQCGKCKKQFNSLSTFVSHKQNRCIPAVLHQGGAIGCMSRVVNQAPPCSDANGSFSASVTHILNKQQSLAGYNPIPQSPLTQSLGQGMVLTDDLMPFPGLEQAISNSTLQVGASMQGNPFLSQVSNGGATCPMTTSTNFATIATQSFASGNSAFTSAIPMNPVQLQQMAPPQSTLELQQVITQDGTTSIGVGPPKMMTLPVVKPNATKIASPKMSAGMPNTSLITVITDLDTNTVTHQCHGGAKVDGNLLLLQSSVDGSGDTVSVMSATKKKLKCQYCDKLFTKNFDLQQHVRSHTGEKPFQCIVCGRAFAQKSNVKKHMQTHKVWPQGMAHTLPEQPSPEMVVTTSEGAVEGVTEGAMPSQIQNVEVNLNNELTGVRSRVQMSISPENNDSDPKSNSVKIVVDNTYICQYCAQKFKSYFQLKSHMVEHKSEQVYKCIMSTCSLTFTDLDGFLEHTKTHEDEMNYRCHVCNKHFPSLYELGVHQYSHSLYPNQGPKPGPKHFRCVKCNNKYATPEALHHHMVTTTHKFSCPHCSKTFTCERYLRRHLPTHGTIGEYECDICKKCFKTDHYLKMHMLIHSGEKPFLCDQCSAAFNRKDKLKRHMLIHEPNKKYKCPFKSHTGCTKAFNRPDKLKAHIITHSGIKPYQCGQCGKMFSRRPHLVDHERLHRNDYRYSCSKCGKGFLRMQVFKRHRCRGGDDDEGDDTAATTDDTAPHVTKMRRRPIRRKAPQPPKKRLITVTEESIKAAAAAAGPRLRRGRPRKAKNVASQDNNVIVIQPLTSGGSKVETTPGTAVVTTASNATVTGNADRSLTMNVDANGLLQQQQKVNVREDISTSEVASRLERDQLAELTAASGVGYNGEMVDNVVCGMATLQSLSLVPTGDNSAKLVVGGMLTADGGSVVSMSDGALGTMPSSVTYVSVPVTSMTDLGGGNMGTTFVTAETCNPTEHLASTGSDHSAAYGSNARTVLSESAIAVTGHADTDVTYVTADHNGVVHVANPSLLTHGQATDTVAYLTATAADQNMAAMVSMSDAGQVDAPVTYVTLEQLAQYQTAGDSMLDGTDALLATPEDILKVTNA